MTTNFHSDILVKKKKRHFFKNIGLFLIVILSLTIVVFSAEIFSVALTGGTFDFSKMRRDTLKIDNKTLYAILMEKTEDKFQAYKSASKVNVLGGAGFIWKENEKYFVIGNIYESEDDAKKVVNEINTKNSKFNCEVMNINFKKIKLDLSNLNKEEKNEINKSINKIFELYEQLYDLSNNVDLEKITFVQASSMVNKFKSEFKINIEKLNNINASKNLDFINKIRNTQMCVVEILDSLVIRLLEDGKLNYLIKQTNCEVLYNLYNLVNSL